VSGFAAIAAKAVTDAWTAWRKVMPFHLTPETQPDIPPALIVNKFLKDNPASTFFPSNQPPAVIPSLEKTRQEMRIGSR